MRISVKGIDGQTSIYVVDRSDTVETLKEMIHATLGVPPGLQVLFHGWRQLEDGHTLTKYAKDLSNVTLSLAKRMQIFVKGTDGKTSTYDVDKFTTVEMLREMIHSKLGVAPHLQLLVYGGKTLHDGHTLTEYACNLPNATLHLSQSATGLPLMQIFVKPSIGKSMTIYVDKSKRIDFLKKRIHDLVGISPGQQQLFFGGKQLDDHFTLEECNLKELSTVDLVEHYDIFVKISDKTTVTIPVDSVSCTVKQFEEKIEAKLDIDSHQQYLTFAGMKLEDGDTLMDYNICHESTVYLSIQVRTFTERQLMQITNGYKTVLGSGGFSIVYSGRLDNNKKVAVKRPKTMKEDWKKDFENEIEILSQLRHRNIVKLFGYSSETDAPALVLEYISNGTLFDLLHKSGWGISLGARLRIATKSAEALAYIHSYPDSHIIHGDVKSGNILLDETWEPKISDFGLSNLLPRTNTEFTNSDIGSSAASTKRYAEFIRGCRGYMDPEFQFLGRQSRANDTYSFGVVLLELITRRQATSRNGMTNDLVEDYLWAYQSGLEKMFDKEIATDKYIGLLKEFGDLALKCLRRDINDRPSMKKVAQYLSELRDKYNGIQ